MANIAFTWRKNNSTGLMGSHVPVLSSNHNYRVAMGYKGIATGIPMTKTSHRVESSANAYFKWASKEFLYSTRLCWSGGVAPFKITLLEYPTGAYLGTGGVIQEMTRTVDPDVAGLYHHALPEKWATVSWQPGASDTGTKFFKAVVEDDLGNIIVFKWYTAIDETKFIHMDAVGGSDANPGTWLLPKQTFGAGHAMSGKIVCYKTAGSYQPTGSSTSLHNSANIAQTHIGLVDGVVFDMSVAQFGCSAVASDLAFINIELNGCVTANANARVFDMGSKVERAIWWKCRWKNVLNRGATSTDNPTCVMLWNLSGSSPTTLDLLPQYMHTHINFIECTTDPTVTVQMMVLFSTRYVCIENNAYVGPASMVTNNGGNAFHLKDGTSDASIRFNTASGNVSNGGNIGSGLISASNQAAYYCKNQEICYNRITTVNCYGIAVGGQSLVAGTGDRRPGSENVHIYRNTIIATTNNIGITVSNWLADDPFKIADNLIVTTSSTNIASTGASAVAFVATGDNAIKPLNYVDGNGKIAAVNKSTSLGRVGAEIASTIVT
jgi:hypothetical protein